MGVKIALLRTNKKTGKKTYGLRIHHNGKKRVITVGTKSATQKAKIEAELEIAKDKLGILETVDKTKSFGAVTLDYLEYIHTTKSIATDNRYKGILNKKLKPLDKRSINKITRGDVRSLLLKLYKGGASKASIGLYHTVLSGVFHQALEDELIHVIPTRDLLRRLGMVKDKKEITPFTAEQIDLVLNTVDQEYRPFLEMAFHTGCRVGELCALQWKDVDFNGGSLRISKTAKDQFIQNSTKIHVNRNVEISDKLFTILVNLKKQDRAKCMEAGIKPKQVFHAKGILFSQNTLRRKLNQACEKLGIGHHTIHDIRHTTASILLSRGVPLLYVSKLLGHSSPKITLDQYSHYMPSKNKGLINSLDDSKSIVYKGALNSNK